MTIDLKKKRKRVLELTNRGFTVDQVAWHTGLTKTQVELILIAWAPRGTE